MSRSNLRPWRFRDRCERFGRGVVSTPIVLQHGLGWQRDTDRGLQATRRLSIDTQFKAQRRLHRRGRVGIMTGYRATEEEQGSVRGPAAHRLTTTVCSTFNSRKRGLLVVRPHAVDCRGWRSRPSRQSSGACSPHSFDPDRPRTARAPSQPPPRKPRPGDATPKG